MTLRLYAIGMMMLLINSAVKAGEPPTLFETRLDNGLQIVVKQDQRAPVVVHQMWYRVGANYEPQGLTGVSHMLEHMMFKGTETMAPGAFSRRVSQMGGRENAFTSANYTAYFQIIGKQHLAEVMQLESDRMANLTLTEEEFQPERNVVVQERMWAIEDRPSSKLFEQFKATAYLSSPERNPVIGWMADIKNYQLADLQAWYERWYAPNNATLVVVGDVEPQEVVKLAKQTYGQYPAREILQPRYQPEIPQQGMRRIELKDATPVPSIILGFHVPSLVTAEDLQEVYALSVLASILDGDSGRLTQDLVRDNQIASSIGAFYRSNGRLGSQFFFSGQPQVGVDIEQLEAEILTQIERIKAEPMTEQELNRVLAQAEAQHVYRQDSVQAQAMSIGMMVSVGLPADTLENWADKLRTVTPEQIQAVAKKYLHSDNLTVGILRPSGETNRRPTAKPDFGGRSH
ncbi:insulinase family protein [Thiomicrospira microaerophila]|uniref:M16 family metallopeptidase n=1 Tax=Thiomicrospira microaerophila TaxID=406020 RepID=UPI00200C779A|nr:pitrilysin family protein [Thiomicrospira microaerophila]UQB41846.1 insulinase family protein [Thiomicrospira microaerophila]